MVVIDYESDISGWVRDHKYALTADANEAAIEQHARLAIYRLPADLVRIVGEDQAVLTAARAKAAESPYRSRRRPKCPRRSARGTARTSPRSSGAGPTR